MFLSKSYPEGFVPVGVIDMQFLTMAIGEDGTIYTRVKDSNLLFNSSNFLDRPLTSDEEGKVKVDGSMIAYAPFDEHGGMVLYDKILRNICILLIIRVGKVITILERYYL